MKELTVQEILGFSRDIEKESYSFYTRVETVTDDRELKTLAAELARSEEDHYNRICRLLEAARLPQEELSALVSLSAGDYEFLVTTRTMPEAPDVRWILETALAREISTGSVYRALLSFTNLSEDVIKLFSDLVLQEEGHAGIIRRKLERL